MHADTSILDKIEQVTVDDFHMVQVFQNNETGELWYIPYYTRNSRHWKRYLDGGKPIQYSSYPAGALVALQRALRHTRRPAKILGKEKARAY